MPGVRPPHQGKLPNDMELYDNFRWPGGVPQVPWDRLTAEQKKLVMQAYRFGGYRTGSYQAVSFKAKGGNVP